MTANPILSANPGINIGLSISQAINEKKLNNFIIEELKKLPLDPNSEKVLIFNVVRFDNFFFQKRFVFVITNQTVYVKKQLDKKSSWTSINRSSLRPIEVNPSFWDKIAVQGCDLLYSLSQPEYPSLFPASPPLK